MPEWFNAGMGISAPAGGGGGHSGGAGSDGGRHTGAASDDLMVTELYRRYRGP